MSNNSPFIKGNEWRFTEGKQPVRTPTLKQQSKMIEKLLVMRVPEVEEVMKSIDNPVFLRRAARYIIDGDMCTVVELIAKYRRILNGKEV